jgi:hypothetical protein
VPTDTEPLLSRDWWLRRLGSRLGDRQARYDLLETYYRCENGIPVTANRAVRQSYQRLMRLARTNFAELIVEVVREREQPVGFRTGADDDENGDREAWRIWQANHLDADSHLVHRAKLSLGDAYVIVGGVDPEIGAPLITPEDPRQVITEHDPRNRRKTIAALKVFHDDIVGADRAFLYLPGVVHEAIREPVGLGGDMYAAEGWEWSRTSRLPAPVVPVVRFANRPNLMGDTLGEFESHLPLLDRINYSILNRLEITTLQAFRQRAVKGDLPTHDEDGNEIDYDDVFAADPGALWNLPAGVDLWESGQIDLSPVLQSIKDDVQHLATVTETPSYRFSPDAATGSAEGASLQREGLVFKTRDRNIEAGESWEQVMAHAFLFAGDSERASRADMEILWAPPERFSLSERADAAIKATNGGVPWRSVMADIWQFTPQQIDRMAEERMADAMIASSLADLAGMVNGAAGSDPQSTAG